MSRNLLLVCCLREKLNYSFQELTPYLCSVVARKGERPEMQDSHIVVDNLVELMYRGVSNEM